MTEATFTSARLEDALTLVKRSLGADALIVSSRRLEGEQPVFEVRATTARSAAQLAPKTEAAPTTSQKSVLERVLEQAELPPAIARDVLERAGTTSRTLRDAREHLERVIRGMISFAGPANRSRVVALVGPTGVGKTTTIAKLAARDALVDRLDVVLVSADGYRIGGADQLSRYADLIGLRFEVADDAESLGRILASHRHVDRIYVDTAGRAPRDRAAFSEMAAMFQGAGEPIATHLCLAASTRASELNRVLDLHAPLSPTALTFTKLDEAFALGSLIAAPIRARLPLSWLATGQRVPEDLESATASRLAGVLCGEDVGA